MVALVMACTSPCALLHSQICSCKFQQYQQVVKHVREHVHPFAEFQAMLECLNCHTRPLSNVLMA
jgi:hypothetical protein